MNLKQQMEGNTFSLTILSLFILFLVLIAVYQRLIEFYEMKIALFIVLLTLSIVSNILGFVFKGIRSRKKGINPDIVDVWSVSHLVDSATITVFLFLILDDKILAFVGMFVFGILLEILEYSLEYRVKRTSRIFIKDRKANTATDLIFNITGSIFVLLII